MKITKKVEDRIKASISKFQKVLQLAKDRDLNESDTVAIINDMLAEVLGWQKYTEITSELMIRGTYCDLAIRYQDKFDNGFLIECKRVGTELKEDHMRQAVNYGVNKGIKWVVLTNGIVWKLYKLRFEQPVNWDLVLKIDLLSFDVKSETDISKIFCLTKEGVEKNAREEMFEKVQCVNRYVIAQLILNEPVINAIKKEIKKLSDGIVVDDSEVTSILINGIFKRDIVDDENELVKNASSKVTKFYKAESRKAVKKTEEKKPDEKTITIEHEKELSITEKLLAEAEKDTTTQQ